MKIITFIGLIISVLYAHTQQNISQNSGHSLFIYYTGEEDNTEDKTHLDAAFILSTNSGCAPLKVNCILLNTLHIESFKWDFGNGVNTQEANPEITFQNNTGYLMVYPVTLTVNNANGEGKKAQVNIEVYPSRLDDLSIVDDQGCSPFEIEIETKNPQKYWYMSIDFGDGTRINDISTKVVNHTYVNTDQEPKEYTIEMATTNIYGCRSYDSKIVTVYPEFITRYEINQQDEEPLLLASLYGGSTSSAEGNLIDMESAIVSYNLSEHIDSIYSMQFYTITTETCQDYLYGKKIEKPEFKKEDFKNELEENPIRLIGKMDLRYQLEQEENTLFELFDLSDNACHVLLNDLQTAGNYTLSFNPQMKNIKNYLLSLTIGDRTYLRKIK